MDQKEFTHAWKKDGEDRSGQKTTAIKGYPAADLREELVAFYNATQRGVATPAIPTQLDYQGWL